MRKLLSSTLAAAAVAVTLGSVSPAFAYPPLPPLRAEVRPPIPRPGYFWRPGYWNWVGGRYAWVGGVWVPPGPGVYGRWVPGHWGGPFGRRWIPPHWAR